MLIAKIAAAGVMTKYKTLPVVFQHLKIENLNFKKL